MLLSWWESLRAIQKVRRLHAMSHLFKLNTVGSWPPDVLRVRAEIVKHFQMRKAEKHLIIAFSDPVKS